MRTLIVYWTIVNTAIVYGLITYAFIKTPATTTSATVYKTIIVVGLVTSLITMVQMILRAEAGKKALP